MSRGSSSVSTTVQESASASFHPMRPSPVALSLTIYPLYNDEATITGYEGPGSDITIPATFSVSGGRLADVVCIMRAAFKGNRDLTSVTIESKLTSIESETFMGCTGLVSVDIW